MAASFGSTLSNASAACLTTPSCSSLLRKTCRRRSSCRRPARPSRSARSPARPTPTPAMPPTTRRQRLPPKRLRQWPLGAAAWAALSSSATLAAWRGPLWPSRAARQHRRRRHRRSTTTTRQTWAWPRTRTSHAPRRNLPNSCAQSYAVLSATSATPRVRRGVASRSRRTMWRPPPLRRLAAYSRIRIARLRTSRRRS